MTKKTQNFSVDPPFPPSHVTHRDISKIWLTPPRPLYMNPWNIYLLSISKESFLIWWYQNSCDHQKTWKSVGKQDVYTQKQYPKKIMNLCLKNDHIFGPKVKWFFWGGRTQGFLQVRKVIYQPSFNNSIPPPPGGSIPPLSMGGLLTFFSNLQIRAAPAVGFLRRWIFFSMFS